jgi:hypothetical protein
MPACCLCGLLTTDMVSHADWYSASVILATRRQRCRPATHDPAFQILADQPLGEPLGSQPTLSRWENSPSPRELLKLQDALLDWFIRICGEQVRERGEILLDVDSTDDPTYGQQQLSFFNGGYDQHMYHPLLIFERHTGCLLAARKT